jgi:hypothetical protein
VVFAALTIYYPGKTLNREKGGGNGVTGDHIDVESHEECWVSGAKSTVIPAYAEMTKTKRTANTSTNPLKS